MSGQQYSALVSQSQHSKASTHVLCSDQMRKQGNNLMVHILTGCYVSSFASQRLPERRGVLGEDSTMVIDKGRRISFLSHHPAPKATLWSGSWAWRLTNADGKWRH